jgi:DNA-binding NarL/FixJ family response regulator
MSITLVTVDDQPLIRLGLAWAVAASGDITVVGEAGTGTEALRLVAERQPTVVTLSVRLPDGDGIGYAARLRGARPDLGVVLLGDTIDDALLLGALDADLSAYVTKSSPASTILSAIRHAASEPHSLTSPGLTAAMRDQSIHNGPLSRRELQVLMMMQEGLSIVAIAERLRLSESTVKTYASRIYGKLHVNNRSQALMTALSRGLLSVDAYAA